MHGTLPLAAAPRLQFTAVAEKIHHTTRKPTRQIGGWADIQPNRAGAELVVN
jgi:hypothetical protein